MKDEDKKEESENTKNIEDMEFLSKLKELGFNVVIIKQGKKPIKK